MQLQKQRILNYQHRKRLKVVLVSNLLKIIFFTHHTPVCNFASVPIEVAFCDDSYTISNTQSTFEVCICLPLHTLHTDFGTFQLLLHQSNITSGISIYSALTYTFIIYVV